MKDDMIRISMYVDDDGNELFTKDDLVEAMDAARLDERVNLREMISKRITELQNVDHSDDDLLTTDEKILHHNIREIKELTELFKQI